MPMPSYQEYQQQYQQNQQQIQQNLQSFNSAIASSGKQYVADPTKPGQYIMVDVPTAPAAIKAAGDVPYSPSDLEKFPGQSVGLTPNQAQSEGLQPQTAAQLTSVDAMQSVKAIVDQIKASSAAVNTGHSFGGTTYTNPLQVLSGTAKTWGGDYDANFLAHNVQGLLSPIATDLLKVNRFNAEEIENLNKNIPKPTDTYEQAQAKLKIIDQLIASKSGPTTTQTTPTSQTPQTGQNQDPLGILGQ